MSDSTDSKTTEEQQQRKPERIFTRKRLILGAIGLFWTVFTGVGFGMFIFEEADQQAGFLLFMFQQQAAWSLYHEALDFRQGVASAGRTFTRYFGWLNPLTQPAFVVYFNTSDYYVRNARKIACRHILVPACVEGTR